MHQELKQCQCGATEYPPQIEVTWFKGKGWSALNDSGNIEIRVFSIRCPYCGYRPGWWETRAEAIEAWNTRPDEDALRKEIADLKNPRAGTCPHMDACGYEVLRAELATANNIIAGVNEVRDAYINDTQAKFIEAGKELMRLRAVIASKDTEIRRLSAIANGAEAIIADKMEFIAAQNEMIAKKDEAIQELTRVQSETCPVCSAENNWKEGPSINRQTCCRCHASFNFVDGKPNPNSIAAAPVWKWRQVWLDLVMEEIAALDELIAAQDAVMECGYYSAPQRAITPEEADCLIRESQARAKVKEIKDRKVYAR